MNQPDNILNELRELSPTLAEIPRINVFKVPEGYFETLPALLLLQISDTDAIKNASVPEGYFDNLASNIMARIKSESISEVAAETNGISELVAGIGNKNVFTVPAGYFENLSTNITTQLVQPAKVVRMNTRRAVVRYAAAAVVTGFLAVSAFFIFHKTDKGGELAVNDAAVMDSAISIIKTNSFDKELASLNDADIVNFLESKGQDVDAALVASLTEDEKALPEAEDYLINENTLDDVLKNLDLNN